MKQILQSFKTGETILEEVPVPLVSANQVLIQTNKSLISLGTERMLVDFGKASYLEKARQQPERVKMVFEKIRTEGLATTINAIRNKLDQPIPLGYSNVGVVIETGANVHSVKKGDRVVSNGPHAEVVSVPENLVARIPDNVSDEEAAFTVIGAIGLQGIRLAAPTFGETFVVQGLGLIGLITCQLLRANGCRVIGLDPDREKCDLAGELGVHTIHLNKQTDPVQEVMSQTGQVGADGVLITASASTDEIVSQAARMSRKRGRIVLVGVVGLKLNRAEFYEKELTFQVSCSYGPGRYDSDYEDRNQDYPIGFVRWTEQRNFQAVLEALSTRALEVQPLISKQVDLGLVVDEYQHISDSNAIAILINYPRGIDFSDSSVVQITSKEFKSSGGTIGIIGAGNFAKMTMLPALSKLNANIKTIASSGGVSGTHLAKKFGIGNSTTEYKTILSDPDIDLVIVNTRHNSHAAIAVEAMNSGKHVFVEKPLAITLEQLDQIKETWDKTDGSLVVGYNRRFSPHIKKMKSLLGSASMNIVATMNAGFIPPDSWVQQMDVGGGRIIGEACHFIDLMIYLTGSLVKEVVMNGMGPNPEPNVDNASILLKFDNGSLGTINYFSNGDKGYAKERIEAYSGGKVLVLDNFRSLKGYGFSNFSSFKTRLDKGHKTQFKELIESIRDGKKPIIPFHEIYNSAKASMMAIKSLQTSTWVEV